MKIMILNSYVEKPWYNLAPTEDNGTNKTYKVSQKRRPFPKIENISDLLRNDNVKDQLLIFQ